MQQNRTLTRLPATPGNTATLIGDYQGSIDAMTAEIDTATSFVHVEFFIVAWDDTTRGFFSAMERAVARGVTVRLLADHISSKRVAKSDETFAELDRIGVKWAWMLPVMPFKGKYQRPDLRNHRKIVVVDGRVAFMGSQNLIYARLRLPEEHQARAQVAGARHAPRRTDRRGRERRLLLRLDARDGRAPRRPYTSRPATWRGARHPTRWCARWCRAAPRYTTENGLRLFLSLIYSATERVILTSPYFVPDEAMIYAITNACQRGLEVQLFVSEVGDQGLVWHAQRSYYGDLLRAGVRIFLYPAPYILHAKHFSIDDEVAVIGSSNMDIRSFSLNSEVSLMVRGESFVRGMREVEQGYRDAGRELTLAEWEREPLKSTFLDGLARLTSALN